MNFLMSTAPLQNTAADAKPTETGYDNTEVGTQRVFNMTVSV